MPPNTRRPTRMSDARSARPRKPAPGEANARLEEPEYEKRRDQQIPVMLPSHQVNQIDSERSQGRISERQAGDSDGGH